MEGIPSIISIHSSMGVIISKLRDNFPKKNKGLGKSLWSLKSFRAPWCLHGMQKMSADALGRTYPIIFYFFDENTNIHYRICKSDV